MSNDLIDSNAIYMLNPNEKRKINKEDRKVTVIDSKSIEDYSNSQMIEVMYNRKSNDYSEEHIVSFQNEETKWVFPSKHLDKIKDEYRDEVKEYIENGDTDFIGMYMFKEEALISADNWDPKTQKEKYISYFVNAKEFTKNRNIRSRVDNRFYLLKPYKEKPAIALMDFRYSNTTDKLFKKNNKAYVVIDKDKEVNKQKRSNIKNLMELVLGRDYYHDDYGNGFLKAECYGSGSCTYFFKEQHCSKDKSCKETEGHKFLATAWSTVHSSKSTKRIEEDDLFHDGKHDLSNKKECFSYIEKMQPRSRKSEIGINLIAPNTDGIITTMASFYNDRIKKTVMTLHQWLKCSSISGKQSKNNESEIVHVGHTFDNRLEYLERLPSDKLESIKENERKTKVYRSDYVTVGTSYFSNTFECNCIALMGSECKYCEGVLYINSEQGLKELYDQLTSEDYKMLKKNIH